MGLDVSFMAGAFFTALKALPVTFGITVVALLAAAPFGFAMALCDIYRVKILRPLSALYISFIRGTPIVLQMLIVYSLLPSVLNGIIKSRSWNINIFDINPIWYVYLVFALNSAGPLAELFRSGILAVDKGQHEAALASGLTIRQSYIRVIIPQALPAALPNLCNLTVTLIKNTSLAFIMTVRDITAAAKIEASYGYHYVEAYLDIFVLYILICGLTQMLFGRMEKHFTQKEKITCTLRN